MKQVVKVKLKRVSSWDSIMEQINAILREYKDKNGELVHFFEINGKRNVIIQYDA